MAAHAEGGCLLPGSAPTGAPHLQVPDTRIHAGRRRRRARPAVQSVVREEWTADVFDVELVRLGAITDEEMAALLQAPAELWT